MNYRTDQTIDKLSIKCRVWRQEWWKGSPFPISIHFHNPFTTLPILEILKRDRKKRYRKKYTGKKRKRYREKETEKIDKETVTQLELENDREKETEEKRQRKRDSESQKAKYKKDKKKNRKREKVLEKIDKEKEMKKI